MSRRESVGELRVGDLVNYDGQRMRVSGFPSDKLVLLVALVLTQGKPPHIMTGVTDKRIVKVEKE